MSSASIDKFREAGRIAAHCRRLAAERIKPGVTIREVTEGIEAEIRRLGAEPGFPAQSSRNYVAAHYCSPPDDTQRYEVGDCVKVDLGVHVDGYIADTALTVDLSIDGRWHALIQSSAKALEAAIATVGPGVPVHEVGAAIERAITERGFKPVRNLTGHGLARWLVHCAPQIPNVGDHGDAVLREGQVIAIEPFATDGRGYIQEEGPSEVWMQARARRPPRITKGVDPAVAAAIAKWNGLPIARRYFREFDPRVVDATIRRLEKNGDLNGYPPLVEKKGAMVAQTEHSMLITKDGVEVLTL
ncbi:MAG: type II methionyl aminopeptidase [Planctomycetes bacterium]|nr:type II methionyl aminopeptidase [Planctomycetota bacterium]